ncbi:hypothetical protein ES708_09751 [subsurface metagenome]
MKDNFILPGPLITPVLFMIFNRPDTTQKVFNAIRQAKPKQLFVAADGPRPDKEGEMEKCQKAREIATSVDWDCEVKTLFRDKNLGCKIAVSSAIDWFFENVEEGIILEDDCLPSQSFFWFCQELLKYHRDDTRIMHVSGNNFQFGRKRGEGTYYFSTYNHIWGWATWRRAWKYFDVSMANFKMFKTENQINNIFRIKQQQKYWTKIFQLTHDGKINSWGYVWTYTCFTNNGLSVLPNVNLVSNIGFSKEALHTKDGNSIFSKTGAKEITEIMHPEFVLADQEADLLTSKLCFGNKNIFDRAKSKVLRVISKIII